MPKAGFGSFTQSSSLRRCRSHRDLIHLGPRRELFHNFRKQRAYFRDSFLELLIQKGAELPFLVLGTVRPPSHYVSDTLLVQHLDEAFKFLNRTGCIRSMSVTHSRGKPASPNFTATRS